MRQGKLIICPTPIGNLRDITLRVLDALKIAEAIYAEDTRVTAKLLSSYSIKKRVERLDEATLSKQSERIIERIEAGETIAYCSDAGMPGVSDPGLRLVRAAQAAKVAIEVLPGSSAGVTAYVASGFTCPRFYFGGFFPRKTGERQAALESLKTLNAILIFYESPSRLVSALEHIAKQLPDRELAVCRELTKIHEEIIRASSDAVYQEFMQREARSSIKGEIVLVIDVASTKELARTAEEAEQAAYRRVLDLKAEGRYTTKVLTKLLQEEFGLSRNRAYEIVVSF